MYYLPSFNRVGLQIWRGQIEIKKIEKENFLNNVNTILLLKTMLASPSCIDLIHVITNFYLETNVS